ncbi:MAG: DUF4445 domain-containing protein [Oscillospiraceae bacterium]|nr:DUF4445 domain-containing protein [Oscillospiraceae bacterium]
MYTIVFKVPNSGDVKVPADSGANILELAQKAGVKLDAPCSGNGVCGKCRLRIIAGAVEHPETSRHLSSEEYADGWRLACMSRVLGDAAFIVPTEAGAFASDIRTADLSSPEEIARYEEALEAIFQTELERGTSAEGIGVAVDIGTTTVTAAMLELSSGRILAKASAGNNQIRYGADVINRIIQSTKEGGREKLRRAVREETLIPLMDSLCASSGHTPEEISRIVVAGNTTMEHLLVGADAETIRVEPYEPEFLELHGKTASDLGLPGQGDTPVILAPNVGSYVGGDITAGVLTTLLWDQDDLILFIDLGTNGELVLGNRDFMLTCACSAGPAFEGGEISCGMRATTGAIQGVKLDPETLEPSYDVVGAIGEKPIGVCGSGLIDIIAELFRCGAVSPKGRFVRENRRIGRDEYGTGYFVVAFPEESGSGREITLTEVDIDNFIKAKGAIFSATRTMLNAAGLTVDDLQHVLIAGGIGSGIDIENAVTIGMLPKLPAEEFRYIGNSSLTGACAMLISDSAEEKVFELGRNMTYLELSTHPGYMEEFVAACFLPHTDASLFD